MNKDFHYHTIYFVATKAGFSKKESEIIAYASQYVDDATEHKIIPVMKFGFGEKKEILFFDPVCTAHTNIQYLSCFKKDVQRKIYIPFHFIPHEYYTGNGKYDYRVFPGGQIASKLLELGIEELQKTQGKDNLLRLYALIKTGIALHSYADTWAHQTFSGRHSYKDNDIHRRMIHDGKEWKKLPFFKNLFLNILPDIGHAEAESMPDSSNLTWRYENNSTGIIYERYNAELFAEAADDIFKKLCHVTNKSMSDIRCDVIALLKSGKFYDGIVYDKMKWRNESLNGNCEWDNFKKSDEFLNLNVEFNGDMKWFIFHEEAKRQRQFVVNCIRQDLK